MFTSRFINFNQNIVSKSNLLNTTEQTSPIDSYDPFALTQIPFAIAFVTLIIIAIILYYYFSIKKLKSDETPKGFALLIFILINYMKQLVFEILGPKFIKITPYFLFLFGYIMVSNLVGILGIENPTGSVTVTLSLGFVTFLGTFIVGFKYQRISYLKKFLVGINVSKSRNNKNEKVYIPLFIQPLEMIGSVTPLISISLRLWGNIFAGIVIMSLLYSVPLALWGSNPLESNPDFINNPKDGLMVLMGVVAVPFNAYLDLLTGTVQAVVFTMLTMVYWKMSIGENKNELDDSYIFKHFDNDCCVKLTTISKV